MGRCESRQWALLQTCQLAYPRAPKPIQEVAYRGVEIHKNGPWDVLSAAGLGEESTEGSLGNVGGFRVGPSIRQEAVLQKVTVFQISHQF